MCFQGRYQWEKIFAKTYIQLKTRTHNKHLQPYSKKGNQFLNSKKDLNIYITKRNIKIANEHMANVLRTPVNTN